MGERERRRDRDRDTERGWMDAQRLESAHKGRVENVPD